MKKNIFINALLVSQTLALLIYSYFAFNNEGPNLLGIMIANVKALNWSGQFNLDFSCYLILSGLWLMWRNKFDKQSIALGLLAMVGGIIFFAPYLLYLFYKEKYDLKRVLCGKQ
jgi:hypothetical protein